jgi:flagellar hook-basal body complex protein FliE
MKVEGIDLASLLSRAAPTREPDASPLGAPARTAALPDFGETLRSMVRGADVDQKVAEHHAQELANERGDVVETMVALSKAELSLRTVTEVRNRALEAFHEIMRLQV